MCAVCSGCTACARPQPAFYSSTCLESSRLRIFSHIIDRLHCGISVSALTYIRRTETSIMSTPLRFDVHVACINAATTISEFVRANEAMVFDEQYVDLFTLCALL